MCDSLLYEIRIMQPITVPRKLVWLIVACALGMGGTGVGALVAEVIGASKSRAIQAVQMGSLIESIDKIGVKLDTSVKTGSADRDFLRARISVLEQHASRTDGDVAGILRALSESRDRLSALEIREMPIRSIDPEGG